MGRRRVGFSSLWKERKAHRKDKGLSAGEGEGRWCSVEQVRAVPVLRGLLRAEEPQSWRDDKGGAAKGQCRS